MQHAHPQAARRLALASLVILVAGLAGANIYLAQTPMDIEPDASAAARPRTSALAVAALTTPLDAKPASAFTETVARPLFNAQRKPAERPASAAAPQAGPEELRLMGILQVGSGPRRALIRPGGEQKGVWVHEGEEVGGWTLRSIGTGSVVVGNGGASHELSMSMRRAGDERRSAE